MPDFESIYTVNESRLLKDAYDAITWCELWDWMREYAPAEGMGFMFSSHPNLTRIDGEMKLIDEHSGASYGWTMRQMQSIAILGWDEHKRQFRRNRAVRQLRRWAEEIRLPPCGCRASRGYASGSCGVAGGGVPGCDH